MNCRLVVTKWIPWHESHSLTVVANRALAIRTKARRPKIHNDARPCSENGTRAKGRGRSSIWGKHSAADRLVELVLPRDKEGSEGGREPRVQMSRPIDLPWESWVWSGRISKWERRTGIGGWCGACGEPSRRIWRAFLALRSPRVLLVVLLRGRSGAGAGPIVSKVGDLRSRKRFCGMGLWNWSVEIVEDFRCFVTRAELKSMDRRWLCFFSLSSRGSWTVQCCTGANDPFIKSYLIQCKSGSNLICWMSCLLPFSLLHLLSHVS